MNRDYILKIKEKGIVGVFQSVGNRLYNSFVKPWRSMHSPIARLFWHLFQYFPINKNLILFESEPDFCDNAWALYQYIRKERPNYKFVWIVQNVDFFKDKIFERTTFTTRRGNGMHLKTIYYYATARWNFYTHATFQPYKPREGQTVVDLWHGGYVLKATKVKSRDYYDWLISMGVEGKEYLAKYLGCTLDKVLALGQPRIDLLADNLGNGSENPFVQNKNNQKVIMWMPTFRASVTQSLSENLCDTQTGLPLLTTQDDLIRFNKVLQDLNVTIIAKIHHLQAQKELFKTRYSNFFFLTDDVLWENGLQLYEILGKSDALITDYSTVYWDYLVTDNPVGFILDDIEQYEASCGFNVENIKELLSGEHIYNEQQLIQFIQNVLDEKDDYRQDRHQHLQKKVQLFPHGGNCENIVNYFGI